MTPTQIIALVRDFAVVGALAFILWKVYAAGANSVTIGDLKAVTAQLQDQKQQLEQYAKQVNDANSQRSKDAQTITAAIAAHQQPVLVRVTSGPNPVSAVSGEAGGAPSQGRGADAGRGIDLRPAISAFERKYEETLADCRLLDSSWPSAPSTPN